MRTRAERRKNDYAKAIRKKNISEQHYGFSYYNNVHQYSKNKIHCSCPLCSAKTNGKNRWDKRECPTHSDQMKIDSMNDKLKDY